MEVTSDATGAREVSLLDHGLTKKEALSLLRRKARQFQRRGDEVTLCESDEAEFFSTLTGNRIRLSIGKRASDSGEQTE